MKRLLLIALIAIGNSVIGQEKQPVFPIVEEAQEIEWYRQQWKLWKDDAMNGSKNENAWYNYYSATRALRNTVEQNEKKEFYDLCHSISVEMLEKFPESFEANYVALWDQGLSNTDPKYLWKAYKISPNDARLYDELLIRYEIEQKSTERKEMAEKMVSNNYLAASVLNWGYNLLSELDQNAIVLSAGDNDTYALWLNQFGMGYREDVHVLNIHMAQIPEYREKLFTKMGIPNLSQEGITLDKIIEHVMSNSGDLDVHIASSAYGYIQNAALTENLYLTGLSYLHAEESIDNLSLIRRNFEKRYALDYLTVKFSSHRMDEIAENFHLLYVTPLVKLYHMYTFSEEKEKVEEVKRILLSITSNTTMEQEILNLLK